MNHHMNNTLTTEKETVVIFVDQSFEAFEHCVDFARLLNKSASKPVSELDQLNYFGNVVQLLVNFYRVND